MMKKYIILIPLLFVLGSLSVAAAGKKDSATTQMDTVSKVDSVAGEKILDSTDMSVVPDKRDMPKLVSKSKLSKSSLIGYSLSFGAILFTLFVFLFFKKKIIESEKRIDRIADKVSLVKGKVESADNQDQKFWSEAQILALIKKGTKDLEEKIEALKEKKESSAAVETVSTPSAPEKSPVFVSETLYGEYSTRFEGIPAKKLKDSKDGTELKIETLSETTAKVFIVDGLDKTQFSILYKEKIVEVQEGNRTNYEKISIVEPGRAVLDEGIWKITNTIKVNLS